MSIPPALSASLTGVKGFNKEAFEAVHSAGEQVTSIRLNPYKHKLQNSPWVSLQDSDILQHLPDADPIPWCNGGYYLSERPSFTLDPLFHAGCYYVQEASSMFLEQAVKCFFPDHSSTPYRVLDLCAAPGGKSTHLSALFPQGLVVANEVIKTRSGILVENVVKWGNDNIVVSSNDAVDFQKLRGYFDLIVVDAPCSGSGMFRKDPGAIEEWSLQNVDHCSKRQKRILEDVWPALKEDGVLVYCTCSYSKEEDEEIIDWLSEENEVESLRLKTGENWGIVETASEKKGFWGYRFYPDKVKGEGFFMSGVRKKNGEGDHAVMPKQFMPASRHEQEVISRCIDHAGELNYIYTEETVTLIKTQWAADLSILFSALYIKKIGVKAGKVIRDELIPSHELAMSHMLSPNTLHIPVEREMALQYLRRNDLKIESTSRGWAVMCFNGVVLGWIKALPNRINNYYPPSFRILKH